MNRTRSASILLVGVSAIAFAPAAAAQNAQTAPSAAAANADQPQTNNRASRDDASAPDVIVTGSRVVTNGNQAPTPVTVMPTERLLETTPSNIPDALNRLPQFAAQPSTRNIGNAQGNATGNFLNLRRFGSNRNLILLDGNRLPPTSSGGSVDTNTIPQALIQRVEVVTGGASAVYGSDAVTGVVNFVIDKNFNGIKFNSQIGTSNYGDATSWRVGGAVGTPLGDRGHIEFSFDHYDSKGIIGVDSRQAGKDYWTVGGAGTQANPFRLIKNGRLTIGSRGGMIVGTPPAALRDIVFKSDGIPTPFIHGAPTGVNGLESGGDGGVYDQGTLVAPLRTNQAFGRLDYELAENLNAYVQGSYSDAFADYPYASGRYNAIVLSGNPFIPQSIQNIMTATNTPSINIGRLQSREDGLPGRVNNVFSRNVFAMTGLKGKVLGSFDWDVNYIYSVSQQKVKNRNNTNQVRFAAAMDAVRDPATNRVVCQVSLTQFANLFPGCEPLNVFGPTAINDSAYDWVTDDTRFTLTNRMQSANFSVSGSPVTLWAGDVRMAVSGEYRWLSMRNRSSVEGPIPPNCTGLRPSANCTATTPAWQHDVSSSVFAKQNVKEIAGELLIPLLRDVPFIQAFELNLAARYTDYSTSGSVETWKVGASWEVSDELRLRASRSRDIRAPTLQDLFAPLSVRPTGYTDLHTNVTQPVNLFSQGNSTLVPEVANTSTVGAIYQPSWLPRFTLAVDFYEIKINNAIISASGFDTSIQRECEISDGTSPFCDLFERPLPFSDRTAANFPTRVFSRGVNAARQWTRGVDVESNYRFDLANFPGALPGEIGIRGLLSYQPTLRRQTISTVPATQSSGIAGMSKLRANLSVDYTSGGLNILITERWQSSQRPSDPAINFDLREKIPAYSYTDISLNYKMDVGGGTLTPFVTVENLFNKKPPIIGTQNNVPGLFFPSAQGFDVIGRYFTAGIRSKF